MGPSQRDYLAPAPLLENRTSFLEDGVVGIVGEIELFCSRGGTGLSCPSNMECQLDYGNPYHGFVSFDNFVQAFILQFQVSAVTVRARGPRSLLRAAVATSVA